MATDTDANPRLTRGCYIFHYHDTCKNIFGSRHRPVFAPVLIGRSAGLEFADPVGHTSASGTHRHPARRASAWGKTTLNDLTFDAKLLNGALINGQWLPGSAGTFAVHSPFGGEVLHTVGRCSADDVAAAIAAARDALPAWRATSVAERADLMRRVHRLFVERAEQIAQMVTAEVAKPIMAAREETFEYSAPSWGKAAEEILRYRGILLPSTQEKSNNKRLVLGHRPLGVVGVITPFNFPTDIASIALAHAVVAGNTVVWKPTEYAPVACAMVADLFAEAGIPDGVINLVQGLGDVGAAIVDSDEVKGIFFTGSTTTGEAIARKKPLRPMLLELGGDGPQIVLEDADLDAAVEGAITGGFYYSGQVCTSSERLLVHEAVFEPFMDKFLAAVAALKMGDPFDEATDIGPLCNRITLDRVRHHVDDARAKGAIVHQFGSEQGMFYPPTVIVNPTRDMAVLQEETFGPVVAVIKVASADEAVAIANMSDMGLVASLWTRDLAKAWRIAEALPHGTVNVNETSNYWDQLAPFGGAGRSGVGRELSQWFLDSFTEKKLISGPGPAPGLRYDKGFRAGSPHADGRFGRHPAGSHAVVAQKGRGMIDHQSDQAGAPASGTARLSLLAYLAFALILPTDAFQYGFGRLAMLLVFLGFLSLWCVWRTGLAAAEAWLFRQAWPIRLIAAGAVPLGVLAASLHSPHKVRVVEAGVIIVIAAWLACGDALAERWQGRKVPLALALPSLALPLLALAVPLLNLVSGLSVYKLSDVATTTVDAVHLLWHGANPWAAQIDAYGAINGHGAAYGGYKYLPLMIVAYLPFVLPFGANAVLWVDAAIVAALAALVWMLARRDAQGLPQAGMGLIAIAVLLATPELAETSLAMGYNDALGMALVLAAMVCWRRSARLAGLLIGFSLSCKLMPGLVAMTLLFPAQRWKPYMLGLLAGLLPDLVALAWAPLPFVRNVLLFNFVRLPDSTSWRMLAPGWVGRVASLAALAFWLGSSLLVLVAHRLPAVADLARLDRRMMLFVVAVLLLIITGSTAHDDYMIWWMPAALALFARDRGTHKGAAAFA
eukprot:gene5695-5756_t